MTDEAIHITLADGTLIDSRTGKRVVSTEINKAFSDKPKTSSISKANVDYEGSTRRFIDDLPVQPAQSRVYSVVLAYTLFGLVPADIAFILGTDVETIEKVVDSDPYNKMLEAILQNVREHDKDKVRKKINADAENAARKITSLVDSRDEKVALKAATDVLDRVAGNGLSANRDGNGNGQSSLTIRIIDDRDNPVDKVQVDIDA